MVIGVDLGATNLHAGVIDAKGVIKKEIVYTYTKSSRHAVIDEIADVIRSLKGLYPSIEKAGIVCAGSVDTLKGIVIDAPNMADWRQVPIVDILKEETGLDIRLDNDAVGAALSEGWLGKARGVSTFIAVTLGTGVGVGVVVDGKVFRGGLRRGTEWGHIMMSMDSLYRCGCGNMGCIETFCSATALMKLARSRGMKVFSAQEVCLAAERNDDLALEVLDEYARFLAIAMYNYIIVLGPEVIVLSGGLSGSSRLFLPKAVGYLKGFMHGRVYMMPPGGVVSTDFFSQAGFIGAAYLCMKDRYIEL